MNSIHGQQGKPVSGPHGRELAGWLRQQRQDRFWSRAEMARQLLAAARAHGDTTVPDTGTVALYIYRWERGANGLTDRYKMYYCKALGIPPSGFGVPGPPPPPADPDRRAAEAPGSPTQTVLGFLASLAELWQEATRQPAPGSTGHALSEAGPDRALDALRLAWGDAYAIGHGSGQWQAMRRDGTGHVLTGAGPDELNAAIRADWTRGDRLTSPERG